MKMGVVDAAGAVVVAFANKPAGFASVVPAALLNRGFVSWLGADVVAPKMLLFSVDAAAEVLAAPKRLLVSLAGAAGVVAAKMFLLSVAGAADVFAAPKRFFVSVAGAAGVFAVPKMLPVPVEEAAGVLDAPKMLVVPVGFAASPDGAGVAEPNREDPDLFSLLPNTNFFAAGSSLLLPAGAVLAPKILLVGFAESVENREGAGFSDWASVV